MQGHPQGIKTTFALARAAETRDRRHPDVDEGPWARGCHRRQAETAPSGARRQKEKKNGSIIHAAENVYK
jgi:hypothetical protein